MSGLGHRSRAGALARDPASLAFARSGFRVPPSAAQKSASRIFSGAPGGTLLEQNYNSINDP